MGIATSLPLALALFMPPYDLTPTLKLMNP